MQTVLRGDSIVHSHSLRTQDESTVISPTAGGTSVVSDSDTEVPPWQARVRHQMDEDYGDDVEGGCLNPAAVMFEDVGCG